MGKKWWLNVSMVFAFFILSLFFNAFIAFAGETEEFMFRDGITFGMSEDEVIQTEENNKQMDPEQWDRDSIGDETILYSTDTVEVDGYEANLMYVFYDDAMQIAMYDFRSGVSDDMYKDLTEKLSDEYGKSTDVSSSDALKVFDRFEKGEYEESDISEGLMWKDDNVLVYQAYYIEEKYSFAVMYFNPSFDYESVCGQTEA